MYCKDSGTKHVKNAVGLKKCLFNCSKSPSYTKARTGTPLHAGSEAASEPSTAADTEISPVEGECNTHTNKPPSAAAAAAMSALRTGKSSPSKCTSFLYFDSKNQTGNSQLDERLGRAIFSTGSPLSLVENKDWITFIEKNYAQVINYPHVLHCLAGCWKTSTNVLKRSSKQQNKIRRNVCGFALQTDACSNQRNESVVGIVVTNLRIFFFFKTLGRKA